jgi:hypothetical protein
MRHGRRTALIIGLLLFTAAACGDGDSPSAVPETPTTATPATIATTTLPPTTVAPKPAVTLDSPGAQPRQPMALRLAAGSSAKVAMVSKLTLKITVAGQAVPPSVVPGTRQVITQRVDKVEADGAAVVSVTFSDASVVPTPGADPAVVQATQAGLEPLNRIRGTQTIDPDGAVRSATFDTSAVTDPAIKGTLDSMTSQLGTLSAPFPREPVGVGARWTVTSTATIAGLKMTTTTRYTLRSRSGDRYELDQTQDAMAVPGPVPLPNLPAGAQASVTSFTVKSTGQISGDLTRHLPTKSSIKGTGDGAFSMTIGSEKASLIQNMTMEMTTSPA